MDKPESTDQEAIIPTTCASHCGGTCVLNVHVKSGQITRIETDSGEEPQFRACLRGRAYRRRVYAPDRLLYPVKRVGERGEGKFERISWDEALSKTAEELKRVNAKYGPASILYIRGAGDLNQVHNLRLFHKLLSKNGGYTSVWGAASFQAGINSAQVTYGTYRTTSSREDLLNSRLIILWGWNPASTISGTNTSWYLARAKESGTKIIAIDPKYTDTAAVLADRWIPIRPGTDAAMLIAMAYVIIECHLQDQAFLDKYTIGFEKYKDYVMGIDDGVPKTPEWAEKITGVTSATTRDLAKEYARVKPAALMAGIAPGRTAFGEQYHRAASTLAAMTGNVGIPGGDPAGRTWDSASWYPYKMKYGFALRPEDGTNSVSGTILNGRHPAYTPSGIHKLFLSDFILKGKAGGYPADIKMAFIQSRNHVNQCPDINEIVKAFKSLEFIVVLEQFLSATANLADIVLPTTTFLERNDIDFGVGVPFYGYVNKAIDPVGEARDHLTIARDLAARLGVSGFNETEDNLLRKESNGTEIPDYDKFKKTGVHRIKSTEPYVAFRSQVDDLKNNPFSTSSGKIEIYSQEWAKLGNPGLPPIPKYIETWESRNDPLADKYPLQLISTHFKRRSHTQFDNIPWLRELDPQAVMINTGDAASRGICEGDTVRVFNDRGEISIKARVTEKIMPGVVDVPQGAWYEPDKNGVDRGGNPNVLIRSQISPGGAYPYNTCLVEVKKA